MKERILKEIRRTAVGGVALARDVFALETGISEKAWYGVHWARWSDAVKEAGVRPLGHVNYYTDEMLLERYAALAIELGRVPTSADMMLRKRRDKSLPTFSVVSRRFGGRARLMVKLRQYCETRPHLEEVVLLCDRHVPRRHYECLGKRWGWVYLLRSGNSYKIGRSMRLSRRLKELGAGSPDGQKLVHRIRTDDPEGVERYWHRRFAEKKRKGEWFDLDVMEVEMFRRRREM